MSSKECIGFVGLGTIGLPIAANLISSGFKLQIHTRSRKAESNKKLARAKSCASPYQAAKGCHALLICVSNDEAVEMVLFGPNGADKSLTKGCYVIDLSTISPARARSVAQRLSKNNITYVDAPVTGGSEGAIEGDLTIFLGGDQNCKRELAPILSPIASNIYCFGEVGKGQEVKAINQVLVAGTYVAVAEAIALGENLNLPMELVINALQKGAGASWALSNRSKAMLADKYPLGFKLELHHKDLGIAMKIAKDIGLNLEITNKVKELEESLIRRGYQNNDVSVLKRYLNENVDHLLDFE